MNNCLKYLFPALLSCYCVEKSSAQTSKIDSLQRVLVKTKTDTTKINILLSIADTYSYTKPDSSVVYSTRAKKLAEDIKSNKFLIKSLSELGWDHYVMGNNDDALLNYVSALDLSKKIRDKKGIFSCLAGIGDVYWNKGDYQRALDYFYRALKIAKAIHNKNGILKLNVSLGIIYMQQGVYTRALECFFRSLKIAETSGNKTKIAAILTNIGIVYKEQRDFAKSLRYYLRALKMSEQADDKNGVATQLNNIGTVYLDIKKFDTAHIYYFRALQMSEELNDKIGIAINVGNIGLTYAEQGENVKALECCFKALKMNEDLSRKSGMGRMQGRIGSIYLKMKNFSKAETYLQSALSVGQSIGALELVRDNESALSNLYSLTGKHDKALEHYKKYTAAKDSLFNLEVNKKSVQTEMNFEFEKKATAERIRTTEEKKVKDAVIAAKTSKLKEQQTLLYTFIGLAVFSTLLIVLVFNQRRLNLKRKSLEEKQVLLNQINQHQKELLKTTVNVQETERKRIAAELHDGIGGLLSAVKLNLDSCVNKLEQEGAKKEMQHSVSLLDEACTDLRAISHNMMPVVLVKLGLVSAIRDFVDKINSAKTTHIRFEAIDITERLAEHIEIALFRVIQEAVSNIIKHAQASKATVQLIGHENMITIMIEDNGKGFDTGTEKMEGGIGLKSIRSRISYLGGKTVFDSSPGKGTVVIIELPYLSYANSEQLAG
ncbi:MAG: tetratricopeptide repeat protein [Flavobacteriales bacterium]